MLKWLKGKVKELNITVTGSSRVGETTIAELLIGYNSEGTQNLTLLDVYQRKLKLHGLEVSVRISDIKSDDSLATEQIDFIKKSDVVIITFLRDSDNIFDQVTGTYNKMKSITKALIVFIGTPCKTDEKQMRRISSKVELENKFKKNFDCLYYEVSDQYKGKKVLQELYEEVEIKEGPYHTTVISMDCIRSEHFP